MSEAGAAIRSDSQRTPKISVIIPAYNVSSFIRQAVQSALAQTAGDLEIILIDDGSSDGTIERLACIDDPRLRILRTPHAGIPNARNTGIEAARGRYIGFLDGDDLWAPSKLEEHLKLLDTHPEIDLTFSHSLVVDECCHPTPGPARKGAGVISFRELLVENLVRNGSSVVLRRDCLLRAGLFDPAFPTLADLDLWLRIARLQNGNIYCIPRALTTYRRRPNQLSQNRRRIHDEWERMIAKVRTYASDDVRSLEGPIRTNLQRYLCYLAYEDSKFREGLRHLLQGFRASPRSFMTDLRNWLATAGCIAGMVLPAGLHSKLARFPGILASSGTSGSVPENTATCRDPGTPERQVDVSVVVVSYNTRTALRECLSSVVLNTYGLSYDIVVIDNASTDGSAAMVRREFPEVRVLESEANLGFARAANRGYKNCSGKYVFFLNSDTLLLDNAAKAFHDFMEQPENQRAFACGGTLVTEDGSPAVSCGNLPSLFEMLLFLASMDRIAPKGFMRRFSSWLPAHSGPPYRVGLVSGADLFLRRSSVPDGVPFDEEFFLYFEDTELCFRLAREGGHAVIVPDVRIFHACQSSSVGNEAERVRIFERSKLLYFRKCHGRWQAWLLVMMYRAGYLVRFMLTLRETEWQRFRLHARIS